jgi:hypothetical protein
MWWNNADDRGDICGEDTLHWLSVISVGGHAVNLWETGHKLGHTH